MRVKEEIFEKMQADAITTVAMEDFLIVSFGDDLLKKNKNRRSLYHISNKLRECGKFLIEMRKLGPYTDMLSVLKPEHFDDAIEATKRMSRYDLENKSFGSASLALHFGTNLKKLSELATKLLMRKTTPISVPNVEEALTNFDRFEKLVKCQWATELGSLALKDLTEKSSIKPKLLPLTEDIMKMKNIVEQIAKEAFDKLKISKSTDSFRVLAETTLLLTILHNRKRVGDIQYLELGCYKKQFDCSSYAPSQHELTSSLTENEMLLTKHYKRIVAVGKGSRPVIILIPKDIQEYFSMIYDLRQNTSWFPNKNMYFFTYPTSMRWIDGCSVLRKYAKMSGVKHPELLTSCRLRKHIATVTQVLSLKENEVDQFAKFMGHTKKPMKRFISKFKFICRISTLSSFLKNI